VITVSPARNTPVHTVDHGIHHCDRINTPQRYGIGYILIWGQVPKPAGTFEWICQPKQEKNETKKASQDVIEFPNAVTKEKAGWNRNTRIFDDPAVTRGQSSGAQLPLAPK